MKFRALLLCVLLLMSMSVAAHAQDEITLLVWDQHSGPADDAATQIYDNFMALHPNITIERELVPFDQIRATARTALASGTGPDVLYHDVTPSRELFRAGLIVPLGDYAEQYGWMDRFYPSGLEWTILDDQIIGLGLEYEFVGVFVNKTLMEQEGFAVPETLDEVLTFCEEASARGYIPFAHGQLSGWPTFFSFAMPLNNILGIDNLEQLLFDKEGRWDTPDVIRAIEVFHIDMRDAGCFIEDVNGFDWQNQQDSFFSGEALMLPTGTWVVGEINESMPAEWEVEMVPFMAVEEGGERVYTAGMGSAYFIAAGSPHPDAAALFLDYIFSEEAARIWAEVAGFVPPVEFATDGLNIPPLSQFVLETLEAAGTGSGDLRLGFNVDLLTSQEFNTMMIDGFQAVTADIKTAEEQAADLQRLWEQQLAEESE